MRCVIKNNNNYFLNLDFLTKKNVMCLKKLSICFVFILISGIIGYSQTNMRVSNPLAEEIMLGNYNPSDYAASEVIDSPESIIQGIVDRMSTDSLLAYLQKMDSFYQRNTGSDTVSNTRGIGATRRWIYEKFQDLNLWQREIAEIAPYGKPQDKKTNDQTRHNPAVISNIL